MPRAKKKGAKKDNKHVWTEEQEYALIDLYEENEFLYNHTCSDFKNKDLKACTIDGFDKQVGVPDGASKQHIESIRTRYGRDNKEYLMGRSGSARKEPPEAERVFMRRMSFLFKHITPRPTRNSLGTRKLVSDGNEQCGDGDGVREEARPSQSEVQPESNYSGNNEGSTVESAGDAPEIDQSVLKDVEFDFGGDPKWDGVGIEPVDNIPEGHVSENEVDDETMEAAKILSEIEEGKSEINDSGKAADQTTTVDVSRESTVTSPEKCHDAGVEEPAKEDGKAMVVEEDEKTEVVEIIDTSPPEKVQTTPTKNCGDTIKQVTPKRPAFATSTPFNVEDYVPIECRSSLVKSPTPPPRKKPCFQAPKKGVGKSTIKPQSTSNSPKGKSSLGSNNSPQENSDDISKQFEKERLKVLKNLGDSLANDDNEKDDEDFHWTKTLYRKAKNVTDLILKEQSAAVCYSVMSHAVLGQKHPAVEAMFPSFPTTTMGYNISLPNPSHLQQYQQLYYTPPPYTHPNPSASVPVRPQQQGQTLQTQQHTNLNPTPTPPIGQTIIQPSMANSQSVGQQNCSAGAAAASSGQNPYVPPSAEYPFGLNHSPMKAQPNIFCHTLNTYGGAQQQGSNSMEFTKQ